MKAKSWIVVGLTAVALLMGMALLAPSASEAAEVKTVSLRVEGMTCAACTTAVRVALKKLKGVKEATVSLEDKRAVVRYDPARVTPQKMVEAVSKTGFKASVLPG